MSLLMVAPGTAMDLGGRRLALWQSLRTAASPPSGDPNGGIPLTEIAGLAGWWDAGSPDALLDPGGLPIAGWNGRVGSLSDKSGLGRTMEPYSYQGQPDLPIATPRLAGMLGGLGRTTTAAGLLAPALDPDLGLRIRDLSIDSAAAWTVYLVWSRPNWRQASNQDNAPAVLLSVAGIPVLTADGRGGGDRLLLFPGPGQVALTSTLARRHTHSVIIRHTPGWGIDVWLDNTRVALGVGNPLPSSTTPPITLFHNSTPLGSAQCWFHEAACWPRDLSNDEIAAALTHAGRWPRGPRRGILLVVNGQSNAINYALFDGAALLLAQGIAWHVGALAYNVLATSSDQATYTMKGGHGLYPVPNGNYPGSFLNDPGDGTEPATWSLGDDGQAVQRAIGNLSAEDMADVCAIVWPWNETDSLRQYGESATFQAAAKRFLALERGMLNRSAQELPLVWWNAIPYGTDGGCSMHRHVVAALAADPTQNVTIGNPQTSDSNARGASWDPTSGIATGGDVAHRDTEDNQRFARLAAPVVARAIIRAGRYDTISSMPAELPTSGGPRIVHAYRQNDTSLILTIRHDAGTDLTVPRLAATGRGFSVMDGGSPSSPGIMVAATSCVRLDGTHLQLTLPTPLRSPSAACRLYYPYGPFSIGRGNCVTDNHGSLPKPDGWDIGANLGSAWRLDFPLAATFDAVPLDDAPL